jgi:hypothetical protein
LFVIGYCVINWLCILQHTASSTADVDRTECVEGRYGGVLCDVENVLWEMLWMLYIYIYMVWKGGSDVYWI